MKKKYKSLIMGVSLASMGVGAFSPSIYFATQSDNKNTSYINPIQQQETDNGTNTLLTTQNYNETVNQANTNIENSFKESDISDYQLTYTLNNMIDNIDFDKIVSNPYINTRATVDSKEVSDYVKMQSNQYLNLIQSGKFNLTDLTQIAQSNGYSQLEQAQDLSNYKQGIIDTDFSDVLKNNNLTTYSLNNTRASDIQTPRQMLEQIRQNGIQSGIMAGLASALAAGYWAASWFFGLSIPSAVAATAQAVLIATEGAVYGGFYEANIRRADFLAVADLKIFNNLNFLSWWGGISSTIDSVKTWTKTIKSTITAIKASGYALKTGIASTVWAAPTGAGILAFAEIGISLADMIWNNPFGI